MLGDRRPSPSPCCVNFIPLPECRLAILMGAQKTFGKGVGAWQEMPGDANDPHQLNFS